MMFYKYYKLATARSFKNKNHILLTINLNLLLNILYYNLVVPLVNTQCFNKVGK